MKELQEVIRTYMSKVKGLEKHCDRCLRTERWGGSVPLMIVDAAFTSIGVNYFRGVVPKVVEFEERFVRSGEIVSLRDLSEVAIEDVRDLWRNDRSWQVAKSVSSYLSSLGESMGLDDKGVLREWARSSSVEDWKHDPTGAIKGVGINTFQYLRMMGGVDTVMPDKIVRRVIKEILEEAKAEKPTEGNLELIGTVKQMAELSGYRPIEICWMTWLIQPEGRMMRMDKYRDLLDKI